MCKKLVMKRPFRIAAVVTAYLEMSHADVIISRWLEPHSRDHEQDWNPCTQIASLYIEQSPERSENAEIYTGMHSRSECYDHTRHIGHAVAKHHGIPVAKSVHEALTLNSSSLAVDAVLLIGEHGDYPHNALGQKLYPRKELFFEILTTMRESGHSIPVFCDKHYSWDSASAHAMVREANKLGVPLFAGSSIQFTGVDSGWPAAISNVEEIVLSFSADLEAYGYHSLEFAQTLLDQREGQHESGVEAVTAFKGEQVWEAAKQGKWSPAVMNELLRQGYPEVADDMHVAEPDAVAFHVEHRDKVRTIHLFLPKHGVGFHLNAKLSSGETFYRRARTNLPGTFFSHFAALNREIEKFFLTRKAPYPPERVLLTTCTLAECMVALQTPGIRRITPKLEISYKSSMSIKLHKNSR